MKFSLLLLALFSFTACGQEHSSNDSDPERQRPDEVRPLPETEVDSETSGPVVVNESDLNALEDLLPTMYFTAKEKEISCKGRYGRSGPIYRGTEKSKILEKNGAVIATVCTRFLKVLTMEGSAILKDRGQGEVAVNFSGRVNGNARFHRLGKCAYGEGVKPDLCLLPYHTLAADNKEHKIDEIIFIPKAQGLLLPDGTVHEGYFIVRDTGGAFKDVGPKRVDMFTGTDHDDNNVFQKAGFHHKNPMEAYKVEGESAERVKERLKAKFGELY